MRYEDASQTIAAATSNSETVARPDVDTLPPGSFGPATGNTISGIGTRTGAAGADTAGAQPAAIVEVTGAGGATSASGGNFQAVGQYGLLSMDTQGNFNYVRNAGTPDGVQDVFGYTLADAAGARSSTTLTIDISQVATAAAGQAVVNLPPGVELSDIKVVGRDLVITMPDGSQMVIPGGAVFVPQLVIGDVQVPASNLAALLVNSEPQPAAGQLQSSGGNFAADVPPLDPGVPLGDLIPPTELDYTPPDFEDVGQFVDREPEITIQPDGQPASVAAVDQVFEAGLPTRNGGEPEGSGEEAAAGANGDPSEATTGLILFKAEDGLDSITINGVAITTVGQTIAGAQGTLTITSIDLANGQIGYSYLLTDNTNPGGDGINDPFTVVVTDEDGDTATATLTINIVDDVPTARNDTDAVAAGTTSTDGNVMSGAGTTSGSVGKDTVGADNATLTAIASVNVPANTDSSFDGSGNLVVQGQFGNLTIKADGSYVYTLNPAAQPTQAAQEVFSYTLTDGDGDVSTATLTIAVPPDQRPTLDAPDTGEAGTVVDEQGLPERPGEPAGTGEAADGNGTDNDDTSETTTGTITFTPGDAPATVTINGVLVTGVGQTFAGDYGTLTITGFNPNGSITYSYTLTDNVDHDTDLTPFESFQIVVTDSDGDTASDTLRIDIVDDEPIANNDTDSVAAGTFGPETGNVITGVGTTSGAAGADLLGADDAQLTAVASNNVPANSDNTFDGSGNLVVQGQYGVLTIKADGSYSYVRDASTPGGVSDVFTYTLTDNDGDVDTATLTINIGDAPPVTRQNPTVQLDDDALAGGNPGGTGDDPDAVNTSGTLSGSGGDAPLTFAVQTTGAPAGFTYVSGGPGVVLVQQGGTTVLTITVNSATGAYTVVQNAPIDHPAGSDENNVLFTINYTVTDVDGDTASGTLDINVDDDTPVAANDTDTIASGSLGPATGNVITDASAGDAGDGDAGADSVGADTPGSVTGIASNNVPANTDTTADGSGNFVVNGQYGTLTINADGSYSYARTAGTPGGVNDVFTYTLTDADGDSTTATLTISIADATPNVGQNPLVQLDDDALAGGNPGGTGDDPNSVNTSGTLSGSGGDGTLTFAVQTTGAPAGFTYVSGGPGVVLVQQGGTTVLTITVNSSTGAYTVVQNAPIDHAAGGNENNQAFAINYTVTDVDGDSANGVLNINVDDDTPIAVNDVDSIVSGGSGPATGNVITGVDIVGGDANSTDGSPDSVGADTPGSIVGIASNNVPANTDMTADGSGNFVVAGQYGTLTINANGSYSYVRSAGTPGNVSDVFTYTLTDADGDTTTATLTINIADASPTVGTNPTVLLDDDALAGGNPGGVGDDPNAANTSGTLSGSGGDGTLTFSVQTTGAPAGFTYVSGGPGVVLVQQGGTTVLTVTVNSNGTYSVVQNAPIDHAAGSNENNQAFTINYTVTDADGDSANGVLNINVDDDTPIAANDTDTIASGSLGPATGNVITDASAGDAGDSDTGADSVGADTPGSVTGIASNNVPANTDTTADGSGNFVVNGQYGTLTINADGSYSYARNAGTPGGVSDVFTYTLTDADGDSTTATLTISIADATPIVGANAAVGLDDDALAGGNPGGTGDDPDSVNASGTLSGSGGDGPLTFAVQTTGAPAGFTYVSGGPGVVLVQQGGTTVLTITVNSSTGAYTVVQNAPIDHAAGGNENNQPFTINYTVTDVDGDSANGTLSISVDDDTPVAANDTDTIASGSLGPATGNVITDASAGDAGDSDTGADSVGADTPGSVTAIASNNVPANTDTTPDGSGNFVVNGQYGTLTINADGSYSYARNAGTPGGVNDVFTYTLTDGDGDSTTATLTISIGDATPIVGANAAVGLDDDALAGGNPGGTGDDPDSVNTSGTLSGSGGDGPLTFAVQTTGAPAGFTYVSGGPGVVLVQQGGTTVLTITVNSSTGAYTVVQNAPIDHAAGSNENNQAFTINYTVTDQDGDSAGGTLTIDVDDDSPINFTPQDLTDDTNATVTTEDDAIVNDGTGLETNPIHDTNNDGVGENFIGADGFGSLVFTATGHADGELLRDAGGTALTSGGKAVYLVGFGTGTLTAYLESGASANYQAGQDTTVVFTVTLNAGTGFGANSTYTIDFNLPLDDGSGIVLSDFSTAPAGQNEWIGLDSDGNAINVDNNDSPDVLLTPTNVGGTINTSATDIGNANQWIDQGEGVRVDFVTDVRYGSGDEKTAQGYTFDGHYVVNGTSFKIMQTQGGGDAAVRIAAYNDPDTGTLTTLSGSIVPIDQSSIVVTGDTTYTIVNMGDGTFVITGLNAGANIAFNTVGGADYNAIAITSADGVLNPATPSPSDTFSGADFAIGQFGYFTAQAGDPIDLSFGVTASDADGDTSTGTIDVTLVPAGSTTTTTTTSFSSTSTSLQTQDTSSLLASNDNNNHKAFKAGNDAALMGVVAAAGLSALHSGGGDYQVASVGDQSLSFASLQGQPVTSVSIESQSFALAGQELAPAASFQSQQVIEQSLDAPDAAMHIQSMAPELANAPAMTELLQGTVSPAQTTDLASQVAAMAVAMPSAEQLAAVSGLALDPQSQVAGLQQNEVVGKVLVDALNGGGQGPNLEAALNALPGNADASLDALASQGTAAVSNGYMADFAGFSSSHGAFTMDPMVIQQDAAPAHV